MEVREEVKHRVLPKLNGVVQPLLTDLYQITMAYAYWKSDKCSDYAVFDLFFRKNPFYGEFTVFAGLEECLKFLQNFHYSHCDIEYLKKTLPSTVEPDFFIFLSKLTANDVKLYAVPEGTIVFPRVPLLRVEGPLPVVQLLETTLLTLVNYASLIATNAARYRIAAGPNIELLEFGLRRAQGPDGGVSASKYAYLGGFDGTSNVLAGKLYDIPVKGTHAHAFIMSYSSLEDCKVKTLLDRRTGSEVNFVNPCLKWRDELSKFLRILRDEANPGELAAFITYAVAFPDNFLALIDTYDVIRSGLFNFCAVALALNELGYKALGVRIDSGDLAYLSIVSRETFLKVAEKYELDWFGDLSIVASNDINEDTVISLNEQICRCEYPFQLQVLKRRKLMKEVGSVFDPALGFFYRTNFLQGKMLQFCCLSIDVALLHKIQEEQKMFLLGIKPGSSNCMLVCLKILPRKKKKGCTL